MNPSLGSVPSSPIEVRVDRTTVLPGRAWCAERPRALVAIVHGLGEHSGRYAALATDLLLKARFTVVCLDLPGHGEASGPRGDMRSWIEVRDLALPAMFSASRGLPGQPPDLPHVLLGHSMGGLMALDYALAHPKDLLGVVASAPALSAAMPPWWKLALANVARVTSPSAGFPHGLDENAMSRDPEVLRLRKEDPLMHNRISPRLYFAMEEARQRVVRDARRLAVPTLLLHGAADRITDPKGTLEFCGNAPHEKARYITYRDAYHEIYNDPVREQVVRDTVGWLDLLVVV
jgi:alpha-beta hydrolase superfamily lysophospholipase